MQYLRLAVEYKHVSRSIIFSVRFHTLRIKVKKERPVLPDGRGSGYTRDQDGDSGGERDGGVLWQ